MQVKLAAKWKDDCCGKKDYDGDIVSISTRFWPRGGGSRVLDPELGFVDTVVICPDVRPHAKSSLMVWDGATGGWYTLADVHFEGDSFEEVAAQVEQWAQMQTDEVTRALQSVFPNWEADGRVVRRNRSDGVETPTTESSGPSAASTCNRPGEPNV